MHFNSLTTLATVLAAVCALPTEPTEASSHPSPCSSSSSVTAAPAVNNGQIFLNDCTNRGISIADCTQLLNIAAVNGNDIDGRINILSDDDDDDSGSTGTTPTSGNVNNGQLFVNKCRNIGISVLNCAQLLNLAILNGNNINIDVDALNSLGGLLDDGLLDDSLLGDGLLGDIL